MLFRLYFWLDTRHEKVDGVSIISILGWKEHGKRISVAGKFLMRHNRCMQAAETPQIVFNDAIFSWKISFRFSISTFGAAVFQKYLLGEVKIHVFRCVFFSVSQQVPKVMTQLIARISEKNQKIIFQHRAMFTEVKADEKWTNGFQQQRWIIC